MGIDRTRVGRGPKAPRFLAAMLACAAATAVGCGSNDVGVVNLSPAQASTESGWRSFAAGNALEAQAFFEDAVVRDSAYADAENGLGWIHLFFGLFATADAHFLRAIDLGLVNQEAEAGHAIVADLRGNATEALAASGRVLASDPRFVFSRRRSVDYRDLHLLRARSLVSTGDLAGAKAEIDEIDPSNALNVNAPTFVADLLAEIEDLGAELYDL